MKIALCSSYVPFVKGGYRNIIDWLQSALIERGHQVEAIYLPEADEPDLIIRQMMAFRWIDLSSADLLICTRPQAHVIPHPNKVLWFIHHIREYYDLWDTPYRGFPDTPKYRGIRDAIRSADTAALAEAKKVFTNSQIVSERLIRFNGCASEVLYPPIHCPERYYCGSFSDEILCVSRVERHKRQHLLIEALKYTKTPVRLRITGASGSADYSQNLAKLIRKYRLQQRVAFDNKWVDEETKTRQISNCLALAYAPLDEDSYGYPTIEASHASRPILTTSDSGAVLELVQDGLNGYVTNAEPEAIAVAMDKLYEDRSNTIKMGQNAAKRVAQLHISWDHVIDRLLA